MNAKAYMTPADWALVALTLVMAGMLFFLIPGRVLSGGTEVEVFSGNKIAGRYSLREDRLLEVPGPLGNTTIQIKDGKARIKSSPCRNKICIHMGEFGTEGGILVCIPNEIVVRIGNERPDGLDAVCR